MRLLINIFLLSIFCFGTSKGFSQQKQIAAGLELVSSAQDIVASADGWVETIDEAFTQVVSSDAYKTLVDGEDLTFPFGILPDNGNSDYAVVVNNISLDPIIGMTAEMYMKIPAGDNQHLYLLADKVPLSKSGKLQGDISLFLMQKITANIGDGYSIDFKGLDDSNNEYSYVTVGCKGFKELYVNGTLNFDPETVQKKESEDAVGEPLALDFFVNADYLENMVIKFDNIPQVEFKNLPGFMCSIPEITLDRSDIRNAPNFKLPQWMVDSLKVRYDNFDETIYLEKWEGVYIPEVVIEIPRSFKEGGDTSDIATIKAEDIVVDEYGLTVLASALDVVKGGDMKGFAYGVDSIGVRLIASRLSEASFEGHIVLPVCKESSVLFMGITASQSMDDDSELAYSGYADLHTDLEMNAFGVAKLGLTRMNFEFEYAQKQFFPKATLDGSIELTVAKKGSNSSSGGIGLEFGGLVINSSAPYIDLDTTGGSGYLRMSPGASAAMANLPVSLQDIGIRKESGGQRVGIDANLVVKFQNSGGDDEESANGFSGNAEFTIWTKRNASSKKWGYDDFDLRTINLSMENGSFTLDGSLSMFDDDPIYGKGYCGYLDLNIIDKIQVKGSAIFGKVTTGPVLTLDEIETQMANGTYVPPSNGDGVDTYRYWFVDAMVSFSPGIPIASGVEINSFTGGLYYNMVDSVFENESGVDCRTASGRSYAPRKDVLGLIAGIGLQSAGGGTVFNGDINFGLEFFLNGGGLKRIATWGGIGMLTGNFSMPELEALGEKMDPQPAGDGKKDEMENAPPPNNTASVKANWYVEYDFPNKTLVGDFQLFVNLADVVTGIGTNNSAGKISIYSSPDEWYVYVGRPVFEDMVGLDVLNLAKIGGYMCFGSVLPDPPIAAMPPEIQPSINIDYSLLEAGGGLSFGARLELGGRPGLGLGICNARVELAFIVKTGFDILLSKSNHAVYCADQDEARGFKNWYATGQAYIYGEAGLKVSWDCWWAGSNDIELFSMYLSAYLFAQLPKPTYLAGGVSVGFRVLGKGFDKTFDFEYGDQCVANVLASDVNFIEAMNPSDSTFDVSVSKKLQVYFSKPIEYFEYKIQQGDDDGSLYRASITKESISLKDENGNDLLFTYEMNKEFDMLTVTPKEVFPEGQKITFSVTVFTETENGDTWSLTEKTENMTVAFTTAIEPEYIPVTDVYYAYPLPGMKNFYTQETTDGFVRLSLIPKKSVTLAPDYEFNIAFYEGGNEVDRGRNVTYNSSYGAKNFTFDIPNIRLDPGKKYTMKIMKSPIPTFTEETSTTAEENLEFGTLDPNTKDTVILEYDFTTSIYSTFQDKMAVYGTSFSEVFDGVIASELSVNRASELSESSSNESLTDMETLGYVLEGVTVADPLIQFGGVNYDNASLNAINSDLSNYNDIYLKDNLEGGYDVVSTLLSDLNDSMKEVNIECLIGGGCSSKDLEVVQIPKGKFSLPIGYYPPGASVPTSVYNIVIDLDQDLVLPF